MNRIQIIQSLIDKNNYKTYLEIGVRDGSCFNVINCLAKVGVDPDLSSAANVKLTSDDFFKKIHDGVDINPKNGSLLTAPVKYDICFVDGLHHADQVEKDIENCLQHLNDGGTIVCHDMLPTHEFGTIIPMRPDHNEWWGNVYLTWIKLRQTRVDLEMVVVDCDHGCGVIRKGKQELLQLASTNPEAKITYQEFDKNRKVWSTVLSPEEFKKRYL